MIFVKVGTSPPLAGMENSPSTNSEFLSLLLKILSNVYDTFFYITFHSRQSSQNWVLQETVPHISPLGGLKMIVKIHTAVTTTTSFLVRSFGGGTFQKGTQRGSMLVPTLRA